MVVNLFVINTNALNSLRLTPHPPPSPLEGERGRVGGGRADCQNQYYVCINKKRVGEKGWVWEAKEWPPFGSIIFPGWFSLIQEGFKPLHRIMGLH